MFRPRLPVLLPAMVALLCWTSPGYGDEPLADGAAPTEIRSLLIERCGDCHGSQLARPKGKFGFVDDLHRLRRTPAFVVPGNPAASALYTEVTRGKMPPDDFDGERPSDSDVNRLRLWIEAGADAGSTPAGATPARQPLASGPARRIGQFHPAWVHFPVALLIAAALAELVALIKGSRRYALCGQYCLVLGTIGAALAGVTGWAWANAGGYDAFTHRWLGIGTGLLSLAACLLMRAPYGPGKTRARWAYRGALLAALILVILAGHQGGRITYGADHYRW